MSEGPNGQQRPFSCYSCQQPGPHGERLRQQDWFGSAAKKRVHYLGHVVTEDGVMTDPEKIETVREWPVPTTQTEVRSFLGTASYYRRFVQNFGTIARPLHRLTEKNRPFLWTTEYQIAFETLRKKLVKAPILAYPSSKADFILVQYCHRYRTEWNDP